MIIMTALLDLHEDIDFSWFLFTGSFPESAHVLQYTSSGPIADQYMFLKKKKKHCSFPHPIWDAALVFWNIYVFIIYY